MSPSYQSPVRGTLAPVIPTQIRALSTSVGLPGFTVFSLHPESPPVTTTVKGDVSGEVGKGVFAGEVISQKRADIPRLSPGIHTEQDLGVIEPPAPPVSGPYPVTVSEDVGAGVPGGEAYIPERFKETRPGQYASTFADWVAQRERMTVEEIQDYENKTQGVDTAYDEAAKQGMPEEYMQGYFEEGAFAEEMGGGK